MQRVDCGQELHREGLVARFALLGHDQVSDLVGLVDQDLCGALQVPSPVAERELAPERLDRGHAGDHGSDIVGRRRREEILHMRPRRAVEQQQRGLGIHRDFQAGTEPADELQLCGT